MRRFRALRNISLGLKLLAILVLASVLFLGLFSVDDGSPFALFPVVLLSVVFPLAIWTVAEPILVVLAIEENTRQTRDEIRRL